MPGRWTLYSLTLLIGNGAWTEAPAPPQAAKRGSALSMTGVGEGFAPPEIDGRNPRQYPAASKIPTTATAVMPAEKVGAKLRRWPDRS